MRSNKKKKKILRGRKEKKAEQIDPEGGKNIRVGLDRSTTQGGREGGGGATH